METNIILREGGTGGGDRKGGKGGERGRGGGKIRKVNVKRDITLRWINKEDLRGTRKKKM